MAPVFVKPCGVSRYVALGTIGASESWAHLPWIARAVIGTSRIKVAFDDHSAQEALLRASDAEYTVARAPMLKDNRTDASYLIARPGERVRGFISRRTVAEVLLAMLEQGLHSRQIVHISAGP
ncbi:MAG: NAD(P)H-binding protein [Candidatus Coatesbacteria bacterium]